MHKPNTVYYSNKSFSLILTDWRPSWNPSVYAVFLNVICNKNKNNIVIRLVILNLMCNKKNLVILIIIWSHDIIYMGEDFDFPSKKKIWWHLHILTARFFKSEVRFFCNLSDNAVPSCSPCIFVVSSLICIANILQPGARCIT